MASKEIKEHWNRVAELGCVVSHSPNPTIHHCHGGSLADAGINRGGGQKMSDWLVIPLNARYHTGDLGIDSGMGVRSWEIRFGEQIDYLVQVSLKLGYNVFRKAGIDYPIPVLDKLEDENEGDHERSDSGPRSVYRVL
jgi:hypothetical protein